MTSSRPDLPEFGHEAEVDNHGFGFRPQWWHKAVAEPAWTAHLDHLPDGEGDRYKHVTRADMFAAARDLSAPAAAVSAYAWGTGTRAFLVGRRARTFRRNSAEAVLERLTRVRDELSNVGAVAAYASLLRGGSNNLSYLGPSFFTKVLYIYDRRDGQPGRALILDRFVVIALNHREGWSLRTAGPWTAYEYERWVDHAHAEAERASQRLGRTVRADAVEMAYFEYGRKVAGG